MRSFCPCNAFNHTKAFIAKLAKILNRFHFKCKTGLYDSLISGPLRHRKLSVPIVISPSLHLQNCSKCNLLPTANDIVDSASFYPSNLILFPSIQGAQGIFRLQVLDEYWALVCISGIILTISSKISQDKPLLP